MKIFIPSSGRADIISTHKLLEREFLDYRIFVHNDEEMSYYEKNRTIPKEKLINANVPKGVSNIRNAALEHAEEGEWILMLDDNIKEFTGGIDLDADNLKEELKRPMAAKALIFLAESMIKNLEMNDIDVHLIGFATTDNYFFREKQLRPVGFVVGKGMLIKKSKLRFNPAIQTMDDYDFTAQNLKEYGKVLINNYVFMKKKHYQTGGIGSYQERIAKKQADVQQLLTEYPGLFNVNNKRKGAQDSEVLIRLHTTEQVDKWRKELENK